MKTARYRLVKILISFIVTVWLVGLTTSGVLAETNLLLNGDFEQISPDNKSEYWGINAWRGDALMCVSDVKVHSGKYAAFIKAKEPNDARIMQTVAVEPNTVYRFSGWIATENIPGDGKLGATLCVMGGYIHSRGIVGNTDWQPVELVFQTHGAQKTVTLGIRLGYFGDTVKGRAYFDDLRLDKIDAPNIEAQKIDEGEDQNAWNGQYEKPPVNPPEAYTNDDLPSGFMAFVIKMIDYPAFVVLFYILLLAGLFLRPRAILNGSLLGEDDNRLKRNLAFIFAGAAAIAFAVRIPLFNAAPFPTDMGCFKSWALRMADVGPAKFYAADYFCDYPPFPLYILGFFGWLAKTLKIVDNNFLFNSIIKLPSFLCDLATAWLIFILLRKKRPVLSLLLSVIYLFLPAVVYNSSYWGQVDSYYTLLMMLSLYFIVKRKPELAVIFVVASFLSKAQTIAFIPFLFFYMYLHYDWKLNLKIISIALISFIIIILPFNWGKPITWIYDHYMSQATLYSFASFNAANFLTVIGGNWTMDNQKTIFGLSFSVLGTLLFLLSVVWCCFYYRSKRTPAGLAVSFAVIAFTFFMFFPRMHERYLFPALAFFFLVIGYYKDKWIYFLTIVLSLAYLINMHAVILMFQNLLPGESFHPIMFAVSIINTILVITVIVTFQLQMLGKSIYIKRFFQKIRLPFFLKS